MRYDITRINQLTVALGLVLVATPLEAEQSGPFAEEVSDAMKRAAQYYRTSIARHGGYVYYTSLDLEERFGEGEASPDQIWVQPPGTPTVGMAYLKAYRATGDTFYRDAATETGEALIYGQLESGGWTNCIDFNPEGERVARYRNGRGGGRNFSSLDDDQTQAAIRFLMRLDRAHDFQNSKIEKSVRLALDALLAAQFENGAFPHGWDKPLKGGSADLAASYPDYDWKTEERVKNHWDMYTLNDNLAGDVSRTLIEAHEIYGDQKYQSALKRLGDFLLLAQLPEPQPAWAQQYNYQMRPIWARKFEPPAITAAESQDVLETLLRIAEYTGEDKYLEPVPRAISYLRDSRLPDGRLARFYELETNRPLYMERDGDIYSLTYDDSDLPSHYGWKTGSDLAVIEAKYEALSTDANGSSEQATSRRLAERAEAIIESLDSQGRWVQTVQEGESLVGGQDFPPGYRYLSSAEFSDNLGALSEYLESLE